MQSQPTPARLAPSTSGVLVLDGFGVRLRVEHGRLQASDGIGRQRRAGQFQRAGSGLRRVVVIGHTGAVTLDAMRWLADTGTGFLQLDTDGRVLVASAGLGRDDPRLRRAQARAIDTPLGDDIARRLIAEKLAAQSDTLRAVDSVAPVADAVVDALADATRRLHVATSRDEIRTAEGMAAAAYWSAWSGIAVRFARRDEAHVPDGWRRFSVRSSPITSSPRLAIDPANAVLNYLYGVLEAEARLACLIVGLDPGLGVLHADLRARDSLALDVLEPVRPLVDRFVLDMLTGRSFRAADFTETRQGACRVLAPLTHELASTSVEWRAHLGRVAERVAQLLMAGEGLAAPTPITGTNRSRIASSPSRPGTIGRPKAKARCANCGSPVAASRKHCEACAPEVAVQTTERLVAASRAGLEAARAAGGRPGLSEEANLRRGAKVSAHLRGVQQWRPAEEDQDRFRLEVLPALEGISAHKVAARAGISVTYAAAIKRGERVPHIRLWNSLVDGGAKP